MIGLLGGIGAGKSTVAQCFAQLGCAVIDADALAKSMLHEPAIKEQLVARWGPIILDAQGQVDRAAVGKIVFASTLERVFLEGLIHPPVLAERARLKQVYQGNPQVVAIVDDTPLLLEKELHRDCNVLIFVDAPLVTRQQRVMNKRGWSVDELNKRQSAQIALDKKAQLADYCVDNSADQAHCLEQVRRVLSQILTTNRLPKSC
ncbi:MAG: dephospho-CoA kinase [Phycisphaerales bacterium]|nr:dephospho-CoA kinase [Phycisphaerales bacterium]